MKLSARNTIKGKVKTINTGAVNAEVVIELGGTEVTSIITKTSSASLGLEVGKDVYAIVKASNVLIGVED